MVRVGFSTRTRNLMSRAIRWLTGSKASHAWLLVEDTFFGIDMVMEATEVGFRLIPFDNFKAEGNDIVALLEAPYPLDEGVHAAARWIGERYDFAGLLGSAFVLLGRWLRKKWRNPMASSRSMFCSEAVVRVMQAAGYPGSESFDPEATTPQDLLDFFARAGIASQKLARARRFGLKRAA
jgi:hypothetical protein